MEDEIPKVVSVRLGEGFRCRRFFFPFVPGLLESIVEDFEGIFKIL